MVIEKMGILAVMLMNKTRYGGLSAGLLVLLLMGFGGQVFAGPNSRQVSYSHDHWPTRWSTAIRQQQTAKFPTRDKVQVTLADLPEAVYEQDLFFSPSLANRVERGSGQYNYGKRNSAQHFSRNSDQYNRDAAFAYQRRFGPPPNNYNYGGSTYMNPYGPSMPAMGPMPGYPGVGFPVMPGVPGAYPLQVFPFGGTPFGYPGNLGPWNMGGWNQPFGAW